MKVGLDLHVIDGIYQGSRSYVIEIFSRVAKLCPEIDFVCFLNNIESFKSEFPEFDLPNVRLERLKHTGPVRRLMWELPRLQKKLALDLLHTQYIIPMPSLSKTVVTIHDVLFESHPEFFHPFFRMRSKILMRIAANKSEHIFTVSEFSRNEICNRYKVRPERISITTCAVNKNKFYPGSDGSEFIVNRGLESGCYYLTVGRLEPRKNHITLFKAYSALGPNALPLVVVGQKDFGFESMFKATTQTGIIKKVIFIDDVNDQELPALYRHCLAFIYPSMAEGFGIPPLEAMASGVPVLVADNTALTEVVGEAGLLVSPKDIRGLSNAMAAVSANSLLRSSLAAKGLLQSTKFSWDDSATQLAERYRIILSIDKQVS